MASTTDEVDIGALVKSLSAEEIVRKVAAFQLQGYILKPSFARQFVAQDGLLAMKRLISEATGNTLAYGLTAFSKVLQVPDVQAETFAIVDNWVIDRMIDIVISQSLVNILRPATLILVILVSYRDPSNPLSPQIPALAPLVAQQPTLAQVLVSRLTTADYQLCANSLMLINALARDAMRTDFKEWARYVRIIYGYGANRNVSVLMYSTALKDLTGPILDFQNLAKLLAKKWRNYAVDRQKKDCRKVLDLLQKAVGEVDVNGFPTTPQAPKEILSEMNGIPSSPLEAQNRRKSTDLSSAALEYGDSSKQQTHEQNNGTTGASGANSESGFDWLKLGFETDDPTTEINGMGFLGLLDFASLVQRDTDTFKKMVLERLAKPREQRCPLAKASVAITGLLADQFELSSATDIGLTASDFLPISRPATYGTAIDLPLDPDKVFQPLYLQWLRLHSASMKSFLRLWSDTGAEGPSDFPKIVELQRILLEKVVGRGGRDKEIFDVEKEMEIQAADWKALRRQQMDEVEKEERTRWGESLKMLEERAGKEAGDFVSEQRIGCALGGEWFDNWLGETKNAKEDDFERDPALTLSDTKDRALDRRGKRWRYVRLKVDRRMLLYADFEERKDGQKIRLDELTEQVDLEQVGAIVFSARSPKQSERPSSPSTPQLSKHPRLNPQQTSDSLAALSLSIILLASSPSSQTISIANTVNHHQTLLTLYPHSLDVGIEWRDALRLLIGQDPGEETREFTRRLADVSVRVKLLDLGAGGVDIPNGKSIFESKIGLSGEFWYDDIK